MIFHSAAVKGFDSKSEMIDAIWSECGNQSYCPVAGGVSFEGLPSPDSPIPNNIKYGLHMYTHVTSGMLRIDTTSSGKYVYRYGTV